MSIILDGTNGIVTPDIDSGVSTLGPLTQALNLGSTGQIVFPTTQNASANANTLDDYEEGTWTPALKFDGASVSLTYASGFPVGQYTKIGNTVTAFFEIRLTNKGTSTGNMTIEGLPFASTSTLRQGGYITFMGNNAGGAPWIRAQYVRIDPNTAVLLPGHTNDFGNVILHTHASVNNQGFIVGTAIYQV